MLECLFGSHVSCLSLGLLFDEAWRRREELRRYSHSTVFIDVLSRLFIKIYSIFADFITSVKILLVLNGRIFEKFLENKEVIDEEIHYWLRDFTKNRTEFTEWYSLKNCINFPFLQRAFVKLHRLIPHKVECIGFRDEKWMKIKKMKNDGNFLGRLYISESIKMHKLLWKEKKFINTENIWNYERKKESHIY